MLRKLGRAVLKLANANPGLKVNRRIHFSGKKCFQCWRNRRATNIQWTLSQSYKTDLKILENPGLAQSVFEQRGPADLVLLRANFLIDSGLMFSKTKGKVVARNTKGIFNV